MNPSGGRDGIIKNLQDNVEQYYAHVKQLKFDLRVEDGQIQYYSSKLAYINEVSAVGGSSPDSNKIHLIITIQI